MSRAPSRLGTRIPRGMRSISAYEEKPPMSSTTETGTIRVDDFRKALLFILDETFDNVHGAYLDPGDSFFSTLDGISAEQASVPVVGEGNSIASQVSHVIFYFDVGFQYMQGNNPGPQDWAKSWELVAVNEEEWGDLKEQLRDRQQTLLRLIDETPDAAIASEDMIGGAMATIAHTAFHLGQIRHAAAIVGKQNH
jgi:hypothetical protein